MNLTFNVCLETLNFEPDKGGEEGEDLGQQEQGAQGAGEAGGHAGEGDRVGDDQGHHVDDQGHHGDDQGLHDDDGGV